MGTKQASFFQVNFTCPKVGWLFGTLVPSPIYSAEAPPVTAGMDIVPVSIGMITGFILRTTAIGRKYSISWLEYSSGTKYPPVEPSSDCKALTIASSFHCFFAHTAAFSGSPFPAARARIKRPTLGFSAFCSCFFWSARIFSIHFCWFSFCWARISLSSAPTISFISPWSSSLVTFIHLLIEFSS